ncbi:MAG: PAS domain S-box protein [Desulfobacteraceae bacterium]|nr:PAS domain S-box protein [Desulfobacteraceae bacterium]
MKPSTPELEKDPLENPLAGHETWYRRLFKCHRDAAYLLAQDGSLIDANPSACNALGRSRQDLLSLNIKDVDFNYDEAGFLSFWSGRPDEEMRIFESRHIRADGTIFPVEIIAIPFIEQGRRFVYGFARDMTPQKQAEKSLKQSKNDLVALIHASPESALLVDTEGRIILCNAMVPQRLGLGVRDMVGRSVFDYMPPETATLRRNHIAEVVRTGESLHFKDSLGDRFYSHYLYPVMDDFKQVTRIAIFGHDITEFKRAEQSLQGDNDLLSSVQEAQSLFISGREPKEVYDNLIRILVRHTKSELGFLHEVRYDPEVAPCLVSLAISDPALDDIALLHLNRAPVFEGRTVIAEKDAKDDADTEISLNHPRLNRYMGIPLYFRNEIMGVAGVANRLDEYTETMAESMKPWAQACAAMIWAGRMVRQQKETEKRVLQLQKAESLGRMAGAVAHHFNNMMAVVIGNLELARSDLPRESRTDKNLFRAEKAGRRAADMSLLMLTYLGRQQGKLKPLDLSEITRDCLEKIHAQLRKEVTLELNLLPQGPIIQADPAQMEQALKALVTNAWESMDEYPDGKVKVCVEIRPASSIGHEHRFPVDWQSPDPSFACLSITDTGKGLDEAMISGIFDPFFTDKFTGRGLGLPVTLGIIKAHGGCITLESKPGKGSTFSVFLPLSPAAVLREKPPFMAEKISAPGRHLVLVVEDEEMVRQMMEDMLRQIGYEVMIAGSGAEAVDIFRLHQKDIKLVVSDLSMPGMNGWDTLAALRKIRPDIPVILASGYDEAGAMESGDGSVKPNAFLHKPFLMDELKKALTCIEE